MNDMKTMSIRLAYFSAMERAVAQLSAELMAASIHADDLAFILRVKSVGSTLHRELEAWREYNLTPNA